MVAMMETWKSGGEPIKGPQNGRANSIGPMGRTSLDLPIAETIHERDFAQAKKDWEEAKAKAAAAAAAAKKA